METQHTGQNPTTATPTGREVKRTVQELLGSGDLEMALQGLFQLPIRPVVNALFSFLLSTDPTIRWSSVTAMGAVVSRLAEANLEDGRVIKDGETLQAPVPMEYGERPPQ